LRPGTVRRDRRNPSCEPALRPCRLSDPFDWVRFALFKLMQQGLRQSRGG
jgi:hypothetical protein